MKRQIWLVALFVIVLSAVPGLVGIVHAREDSLEDKSQAMDGLYTGAAVRSASSCFDDGDCFTCNTNDKVELMRGGGKVTIVATGPSLTYTPCREDLGTNVAWTLTGTYEMTDDGIYKFDLNNCNEGHFPGSGSGTINGEQINVSFKCVLDEDGSKETWNNVVLTKQSGGEGAADEEGNAGEGETGQVDEGDFGQDPNLVDEGETDSNLTVDRIVGDASVSKIPSFPSKHLITTGPRSKVKIRYGDSEIVIGPNSKLRVNTTENKFGQPVIMWEFLNPDAVIYVKDSFQGTRQVDSGLIEGGPEKRIYTNLWRSIMIFYNGSYDGKKDLSEFYGGETNQPEFTDPGTGERSVIVGIKGTEYYFQATGSRRTLFLTEGEIDLYLDADDKIVTLASGEKAPVDDDEIGPVTSYTSAEIDALAKETALTEQPAAATKDESSSTTIAIIVAAGLVVLAALVVVILIFKSRKKHKSTQQGKAG
ncbi:MAG: hypothetical protein Q7K29_04690 [Thermoleophilia bacterium]|nr:hypothetical protein [Thermoleophilia bacterium]